MAEIRKLRSAKRFGTRYGAITKRKFDKIEGEQRKLHKCPYCKFIRAKRAASGIWICGKCGAKFTGKAYTVGKPPKSKEKTEAAKEIEELEEDTKTEETEEKEDSEEEQKEDMSEETDEESQTDDTEKKENDESENTESNKDEGDEK